MTQRTVKDVISRVLREVEQEMAGSPADDGDYPAVFEYFIDMIDDYEARGYKLWGNKPESLNDSIGSEDPIKFIVSNLVMDVADYFAYQPTMQQASRAAASERTVINRTLEPQYFSGEGNPRGSGNSYIFGYFCACDSNALTSDDGAILISGV